MKLIPLFLLLVGCSTTPSIPTSPTSSTFTEYCSTAAGQSVNIPNAPIYVPQVYLNGLRQSSSEYSTTGMMITLNIPLAADGSDLVCIDYFHN